jgi:alpha-D-ribose 1-methylphosphonate 5-triphosphate synthase subunit PhnH
MRLDAVHDLQRVFRKILAATASPGAIVDLAGEAELLDLELPLNRGILLVALALLDGETSFAVDSADRGAHGETVSHMTYAKATRPEEADFVFVLGGADPAGAIAAARIGTLVDPHLGATIVVEVESLEEEGGALELSGPGIESLARLGVRPAAVPGAGWIAARAAKNREFPLGVDLILVDSRCRLAALPRTTVIREEG